MPRSEIKQTWFSTTSAVITLSILLILQLIALCTFMYSQGGANAVFRKQVGDNTSDITILKTRADTFHDENARSINDRQQLNKRVDEAMNNYTTLRVDMNAGFQRIYDILLDDRKTNSANRAEDHRK